MLRIVVENGERMTRKQVWRYYCDFCRKGSLSGGHMGAHEKRCTANPNRTCRMHANYEQPQKPISELIAALSSREPDHAMATLRELADNCPMCILAAIRQSGICKWDGDPESKPIDLGFNFKGELEAAWKNINDAKCQEEAEHARY